MRYLKRTGRSLLCECSGTTAIEYALIIGGIALGLIAVAAALGGDVAGMFDSVVAGFSA